MYQNYSQHKGDKHIRIIDLPVSTLAVTLETSTWPLLIARMGEGGGVFDTGRAPGFVTLLIGAKIPDAAKQTKHHESLHNKCIFFFAS